MQVITASARLLAHSLTTCSHDCRLHCRQLMSGFAAVHSLSRVRLFATPWTAARQASLSFTISWNLLKLMSLESVMPSNHLILCYALLLPSVFPSIRVFSNELTFHIRWPKYWSFSFSTSSSNKYSRLISFRIDWFDLLSVQGTVMSLLQHQFEGVNSSALNLFYCPALTSVYDYWETNKQT